MASGLSFIRWNGSLLLSALLLAAVPKPCHGSTARNTEAHDAASCQQLVREAVANEVAAARDDSKHLFRSRKQTPQGSQTRLYVETRDAMAAVTIAYNDKPLTPEQSEGERNRLAGLLANPEDLKHKHAQEQETEQRTMAIVKALPDAFSYTYDGEESGAGPNTNQRLLRLTFNPNPSFKPPSRVEEVLVGMKGILLIDAAARRIAKIDGTLFKTVGFGWGILGHLDSGGHFLVEQREVEDRCWQISHISLSFTGKILLFKNINIKSDEALSDFRRVPSNTTFAQGVEMLKAEESRIAQSRAGEATHAESRSH